MPAAMIINLPLTLDTKMCQLHGTRVPRVLDTVYMHRGYVNLEAARKPRVVQPVNICRLQRRWQTKRIIIAVAYLDLVAEPVGMIPQTALQGLSQIARFHESFDLLACGTGLLVQLLACGVVDFPSRGWDGQAHVRKHIERYTAADEDGGFEGERLFRVFVVVLED